MLHNDESRVACMHFWGSLGIVAVLCVVHATVTYWPILHGPRRHAWLSISSGTALSYVFTYLLPKLAVIQDKIQASGGLIGPRIFGAHAYVLALAGLVVFFLLDRQVARSVNGKHVALRRQLIILTLGYGLYSAQLGYLAADLPRPDLPSYILVAAILGLHLMGVNHGIHKRVPAAYEHILRWVYIAATMAGWAAGILTDALQTTILLISTFIAGGIMITAIRDELPNNDGQRSGVFVLAVIVASIAIFSVRYWQTG